MLPAAIAVIAGLTGGDDVGGGVVTGGEDVGGGLVAGGGVVTGAGLVADVQAATSKLTTIIVATREREECIP